ncbi:MAG: extracellular solute-binding protein [Spirochaetes bacterium]|nr:extracellular solute-binding protein [Spirochaetota bacterium]MBL7006142.1 extracellular solute-binding protein [Spirochaetia bacterium]
MKKKIVIMLVFCLMASLALFAAGSQEGAAGEEGGSKSDKLVIYTNSGSNGRDQWLTDLAAENGFSITVVEGGGGDIFNRAIAEKNSPVADVVFGLNMLNFAEFKNQDMLMSYTPAWAAQVDSAMKDADGYYHGIVKQAIVLVYNPEIYSEADAPKDWPELWQNPAFQGKYNIFGLGGGTSRTVLASIAMRYRDDNGEYGISAEGWEEIKQYIQHGYMNAEGEDYILNLINNKIPMTMLWGSGVVEKQNTYNTTLGVMNPEVGVPFVVEQVGIMAKTKHPVAAKAFVEWFGTAEVQAAWAQKFGTSPANSEAMKSALPDAVALDNYLTKAQYIDWAFVLKYVDNWVEKIELEFVE